MDVAPSELTVTVVVWVIPSPGVAAQVVPD